MSVAVGLLVALAVLLPPGREVALRAARARRRTRKSEPAPTQDASLALDLLAAALSSGVPTGAALSAAGDAVGGALGLSLVRVGHAMSLGAPPSVAWQVANHDGDHGADDAALATLKRQLELCLSAGVAAGAVLRAGADAERRRSRRDRETRAARLGVRLVLPLGLCVLPAFIALGVVPVVYALARDFLG